jgi:trehalose/maltose hydrolase-like predicted phosphorylase
MPARTSTDWTWRYEGWDPEQERLREALCTLGNGYAATRGAAAEAAAGGPHYPGTYAAGLYNRLTSRVAGRDVDNEDMVNLPNWLPLRARHPGGAWFGPATCEVLGYEQHLDLRGGTLTRRMRLRDGDGRTATVEELRLVHMGDPHLAAQRLRVTPEGWSGRIEVEWGLDGAVTNAGVERYRDLDGRHLTAVRAGCRGPGTVWLTCRTTTSRIKIAEAARIRAASAGEAPAAVTAADATALRASAARHGEAVSGRLLLAAADGRPATVEKTVALHTSRDPAGGHPLAAVLHRVRHAPPFDQLLASHRAAWAGLWRQTSLDVPGEPGRVLRLHLFHVLQTLSPHSPGLDVGVPARGLHGEAYRGHVFWDELFVLPFLNLHLPNISRGMLRYRHRRLDAACRAAREAGLPGAMYPWQSGSDGREETQVVHLNPRSGRWLPDNSRLQHHVGSAVAHNAWQYAAATGDTAFLHREGAEMILQIARFWAHRAAWDPAYGRYRITGVVGPDEYHEAYPGADRPGIDDNAYTNVTAAWVLWRALELADALPGRRRGELSERLGLDRAELERWEDVSRKLRVPWHRGVISQFDGYGDLAELDWDGYRRRYGDIRRLDRLLEAEGDDVNRYQVSKQADVLMLGYLFPAVELRALLDRLGHHLDDAVWTRTVDHYLARTSHGSTLSGLVHGWVLARSHRAGAWEYVREALLADVADIQGGTTGEGIHLGAMGGTLDLVQRGLAGLEPVAGALRVDPVPLGALPRFDLRVRYRGHLGVAVTLRDSRLDIEVPASGQAPLRLQAADGGLHTVAPGERVTVRLPGR